MAKHRTTSGVESPSGASTSANQGASTSTNPRATSSTNPQHGSTYDLMTFSPLSQPVSSGGMWASIRGIPTKITGLCTHFQHVPQEYGYNNYGSSRTSRCAPRSYDVSLDPGRNRLYRGHGQALGMATGKGERCYSRDINLTRPGSNQRHCLQTSRCPSSEC